MTLKEIIVAKATSGQYFLTVCCGVAFVYAVVKRILTPEVIASIIVMVFVSYFQRNRNGKREEGK